MSSGKSFFEKVASEPYYMVGSVMAAGLVVMTGLAAYTAHKPEAKTASAVDWSDGAGRTDSSDAAGFGEANPAMRSYVAKIRDPKNPFPSAQGALDSTQLLRMGDDMPFDMGNADVGGKRGGQAELTGQGGKTLAEMEALAAAGHKTGVRVEKPKDQSGSTPPTPEKTAAEGAKAVQAKVSGLDKLRRTFSGSAKGDKSLFAGFDIFKGFGNPDGKKKEAEGAHDPYGRKAGKKDRRMTGFAKAFGDNAKKNDRWHGSPYGEAANGKEEDCKGVECAFSQGRKGGQEARGELRGGGLGEGPGGERGTPGGGANPGQGGDAGGGDGNLTTELPTNAQAAEQLGPQEQEQAPGPPKDRTTPAKPGEYGSFYQCQQANPNTAGQVCGGSSQEFNKMNNPGGSEFNMLKDSEQEFDKCDVYTKPKCQAGYESILTKGACPTGGMGWTCTKLPEETKEDAGPPPQSYVECVKQGRSDCGKAGDWYGSGKHACGFNTPCEPKGEDKFAAQLGGHPNEVCGKSLGDCTVQWTGNGEKYIKVASCPAGSKAVIVPYGGGVYTCVKNSGTHTYKQTGRTYNPWEPISQCPKGTAAKPAGWPKTPGTNAGDKYCE